MNYRITWGVPFRHLLIAFFLGGSLPAIGEDFEVKLNPGEIFEPCMAMTAGQILNFRFESDDNLRFNIHYHVGDDVEYPIKMNANSGSGRFTPVIDQEYCLMWRNKAPSPVSLNGNYAVESNE